MSRIISYVLIVIGGFVAIYANAQDHQNTYVLIIGIIVLMIGIYRISRNIPSKRNQDDNHQNNSDL